ncbi:MAG: hypothetical protein U0525_06405 [Patescibacteria group bacterium]
MKIPKKPIAIIGILVVFGIFSVYEVERNCNPYPFSHRCEKYKKLIEYFGKYNPLDYEKVLNSDCMCVVGGKPATWDQLEKKEAYYVNSSKVIDICSKKLGVPVYDYYQDDVDGIGHVAQKVNCDAYSMDIDLGKPVIYLYPQIKQNVDVQLNFDGQLTSIYPNFYPKFNGWKVTANPDGRIIDSKDGNEYSYLFWEGLSSKINPTFDEGFLVEDINVEEFLRSKLSHLGLTPKEYNEFIVYWMPKMRQNKYNIVKFLGSEYTDHAKLTINPKPDSILRVYMVYKSVDKPISIKEQNFEKFDRKGFSVVEWGGSEVK